VRSLIRSAKALEQPNTIQRMNKQRLLIVCFMAIVFLSN